MATPDLPGPPRAEAPPAPPGWTLPEPVLMDGRRVGRTMLARLALYYAGAAAMIALVGLLDRLVEDAPNGFRWLLRDASGTMSTELAPWLTLVLLAAIAMLLSLPFAMVYVRTRARLAYDDSLVRTVIVMPVLAAGVLLVVKDSLALAFSLTGIVAAVRFRNNLKDSRDAVYILAAVGLGFALGVGALQIALTLSLLFVVIELVLWQRDVGSDHERTLGMLCLPTAAPLAGRGAGKGAKARAAGAALPVVQRPPAPAPAAPPEIDREDGEQVLRVYAVDVDEGKKSVEQVLEETAKRYRLHDVRNTGYGHVVLDFVVRPKRKHPMTEIIDLVYQRGAPLVIAAESF